MRSVSVPRVLTHYKHSCQGMSLYTGEDFLAATVPSACHSYGRCARRRPNATPTSEALRRDFVACAALRCAEMR